MTNNLMDAILTESLLKENGVSKQKKILEASIKLFAEKGYANTSTFEIAKEAGISEGTLFRYYKTKETLLMAILDTCKNNILPLTTSEFIEILKMQSFVNYEEFLKFIVKNRLAFLKENRQIIKVFLKENIYQDDYRNECINNLNKDFVNFINEVLNAAKERGEIKNLPNKILFRMIFNIIIGYLVSRLIVLPEEMFLSDEEEAEILVNLIMNSISTEKPEK